MGTSPQDEVDPQYGRLITQRKMSALYWVIALIPMGMALLGGGLMFGGVRSRFFKTAPVWHGRGTPPPPPAPDPEWVTMVLVGLILLLVGVGLTYLLIREIRTRFSFFESGVRVTTGQKLRRAMAYADCERFWFLIMRQYVNGLYVGTTVTITMKAKGKRTIKWSGRHKEKPKGLSFTVFGKGEFKGEDELDIVKLVIADAMADGWVDRMTAGQWVNWCGRMELGMSSAKILKGKRKGQTVPYEKIDRFNENAGTFGLFHEGDKKPFVTIGMGETNFWPGMRVMERMWSVVQVSDADMTPEEPEA